MLLQFAWAVGINRRPHRAVELSGRVRRSGKNAWCSPLVTSEGRAMESQEGLSLQDQTCETQTG